MVLADAEIVIEGLLDPEYFEPEGLFGESHGYINLEEFNSILKVTAITRKKNAVFTRSSPGHTVRSSVIKRVASSRYFSTLRDHLGISGVVRSACTTHQSGVSS